MRSAGILMPVSSLPSPYGIGSIGKEAHAFVDFLKKSGQSCWQILPIGPTGYGNSPYQAFSSFAGNPYLIDLDLLIASRLLTQSECDAVLFGDDPLSVDYGALYQNRLALLRRASARFDRADSAFADFCNQNAWWLDDYALFMSIKSESGMRPLTSWEDGLRLRDAATLAAFAARHGEDITFWKFLQHLFFSQWYALKRYANQNGIAIIGDIPIYVSPDSSDVWADRELFALDAEGFPRAVSGVPPDSFAPGGQVWGNPLYDWARHEQTGFAWWIRRLRFSGAVYDITRIDHFRGIESFFAVPAGEETAQNGVWRKGPGMAFVRAVKNALPALQIIAEDLGYLTPEVAQLLADSGFPGMKVLQFAFDSRESGNYLPHTYTRNAVVYTGTHDNTTTADWEFSAPSADVAFAREYLDITPDRNFTWALIRAALGCVCDLAVIPMMDYLCLGVEARINRPSTLGDNWTWRASPSDFSDALAEKICSMTRLYAR